MPKRYKPNARIDHIKERFLDRVRELWELHQTEFMDFLNDSESNKIRITFPATLDFSESTAKLKTEIHFTKVIKDGRPDDFDDPNQMPLGDIPEEARPPGKRKRKPAKKKTETTDEFSGKDAASGAGKDAD